MNYSQSATTAIENLFFNAACLTKQTEMGMVFKVVFDTKKGNPYQTQIKNCGGMRNESDLDPEQWIKKIKYWLTQYEFSEEQISDIIQYETEYQDTRKTNERSIIREVLEELGVYAFRVRIVHGYMDYPENKRIEKNFYFVEQYITPEGISESFKSKDKDIVAVSWIEAPKLLGSGSDAIIRTHRLASQIVFESGKISQEITIDALKVFTA